MSAKKYSSLIQCLQEIIDDLGGKLNALETDEDLAKKIKYQTEQDWIEAAQSSGLNSVDKLETLRSWMTEHFGGNQQGTDESQAVIAEESSPSVGNAALDDLRALLIILVHDYMNEWSATFGWIAGSKVYATDFVIKNDLEKLKAELARRMKQKISESEVEVGDGESKTDEPRKEVGNGTGEEEATEIGRLKEVIDAQMTELKPLMKKVAELNLAAETLQSFVEDEVPVDFLEKASKKKSKYAAAFTLWHGDRIVDKSSENVERALAKAKELLPSLAEMNELKSALTQATEAMKTGTLLDLENSETKMLCLRLKYQALTAEAKRPYGISSYSEKKI